MREGGARIALAARQQAAGVLKGNKAANSIRHKLWDKRPDRLPAVQIHSKIPWLGVHERGKTIVGRMLIQVGRTRMRRAAFRQFVSTILKSGQGFWLRRGSETLLMVKRAKGLKLGRFVGAERDRRRRNDPRASVKRDEAVPVAILVTRVTVKKRLRMREIIQASLPELAKASEGD